MKKRLFSLILVLVLAAVTVCGCGKKNKEEESGKKKNESYGKVVSSVSASDIVGSMSELTSASASIKFTTGFSGKASVSGTDEATQTYLDLVRQQYGVDLASGVNLSGEYEIGLEGKLSETAGFLEVTAKTKNFKTNVDMAKDYINELNIDAMKAQLWVDFAEKMMYTMYNVLGEEEWEVDELGDADLSTGSLNEKLDELLQEEAGMSLQELTDKMVESLSNAEDILGNKPEIREKDGVYSIIQNITYDVNTIDKMFEKALVDMADDIYSNFSSSEINEIRSAIEALKKFDKLVSISMPTTSVIQFKNIGSADAPAYQFTGMDSSIEIKVKLNVSASDIEDILKEAGQLDAQTKAVLDSLNFKANSEVSVKLNLTAKINYEDVNLVVPEDVKAHAN